MTLGCEKRFRVWCARQVDRVLQNVRVGNSPGALLENPREHNVEPGCDLINPCDIDPCPEHSFCNNEWGKHSCTCQPGYIGPSCDAICEKWNPCAEGATCQPDDSSAGYTCQCPPGRSGLYCERKQQEACPLSWWGHPICGPCNCNTEKGFDPSCNKTTGECVCKVKISPLHWTCFEAVAIDSIGAASFPN